MPRAASGPALLGGVSLTPCNIVPSFLGLHAAALRACPVHAHNHTLGTRADHNPHVHSVAACCPAKALQALSGTAGASKLTWPGHGLLQLAGATPGCRRSCLLHGPHTAGTARRHQLWQHGRRHPHPGRRHEAAKWPVPALGTPIRRLHARSRQRNTSTMLQDHDSMQLSL